MSKNLKVLVSSNEYPESALNILKENFTVVQCKQKNDYKSHNAEELNELIQGCSALVWLNDLFITPDMLDRAGPQLKLVATVSAGYNHCLPEELRSRSIKLSNTPNVLSAAVSEIAVGLMIAASRRFTESLQGVSSGNWASGFDVMLGQDIRGSTVGIVGLGGIGQAIVRRLAGFEVGKVVYSGHREKPEAKALNATFVTQEELLAQSDYVVLCVPLSPETKHLLNAAALANMKANAIVINVGRGDLIDQEALYDALKSGRIWAAGLDVTSPEPLPKDHKLHVLPNCFILPHIGSATRRTRSDMAHLAANNVVSALSGKPLITPVIE